jgi:hypothetical protein
VLSQLAGCDNPYDDPYDDAYSDLHPVCKLPSSSCSWGLCISAATLLLTHIRQQNSGNVVTPAANQGPAEPIFVALCGLIHHQQEVDLVQVKRHVDLARSRPYEAGRLLRSSV